MVAQPVEVSVTCASAEEARCIAEAVLRQHLAACAQWWPVSSCYWWNGELASDDEHLVVFKTVDRHFAAICAVIGELHSYELPAIAAVPLVQTGPGYETWLAESTTRGSES